MLITIDYIQDQVACEKHHGERVSFYRTGLFLYISSDLDLLNLSVINLSHMTTQALKKKIHKVIDGIDDAHLYRSSVYNSK